MNTVLFDLDGTLLPMDLEVFLDTYMKALKSRMSSAGFDADSVMKGIWHATESMLQNEGVLTNEDVFHNTFEGDMGADYKKVTKELMKFYKKDFTVAKLSTSPTNLANDSVELLKGKGYKLVIATNPLFPAIATEQRVEWAGLDIDDFELVTTYENTCYTKPNMNYYRKILKSIGKNADECLMVGNDVDEDMCVVKLGIDTFLIKDCLINRNNSDISDYKQGDWETFFDFVQSLPSLI